MTSDFITLACPTCGGKLEISPNTTSLKCPNCGNEHLVRHDAANITLESYARCPVCGRNDEVKKVSAILANQTQSMQGVTIEKSSYQDHDGNWHTSTEKVPFSGTQSSLLAIKLQPPAQPKAQKPGSMWGRYIVLSFASIYLIAAVVFLFGGLTSLGQFFMFGLLGGVLMLWYLWLNGKHEKEFLAFGQETQRIQEQELPKWQKAMERYGKLYYCFRDDCVFIPDGKYHALSDSVNAFVYSVE